MSDASNIDTFAAWTAALWTPSGGASVPGVLRLKRPPDPELEVMSHGLAGELGEAIELLVEPVLDRGAMAKELGDVIYYWARLCAYFDLKPSALLAHVTKSHAPVTSFDAFATWAETTAAPEEGAVLRGLHLTGKVGRVMERLKKRIRDDTFDPALFADDMAAVALHWARLCTSVGCSPEDVLGQNINKIEGRAARGSLRGSGNNR